MRGNLNKLDCLCCFSIRDVPEFLVEFNLTDLWIFDRLRLAVVACDGRRNHQAIFIRERLPHVVKVLFLKLEQLEILVLYKIRYLEHSISKD